MVEANIKIISEMSGFLELASSEPKLREALTRSPKDFTRNRILTMENVVGLIMNQPKKSLKAEIREFFDIVFQGVEPVTKGGFSQQRAKLLPVFFQLWNTLLVESFYHYYGDSIKRWNGFRLLAVDGTTLSLVNTPKVRGHFGTQGKGDNLPPMARIVQAHDVLNDITLFGHMRPICESEKAITYRMVDDLPLDSLTLFDRGFPSYALMFMMINQETPRHFVMRCKRDFNNEVKAFLKSGAHSQVVELTPSQSAMEGLYAQCIIVNKSTTIRVRMVRVKLDTGEDEVLLTNLLDEKLYPTSCFKHLYNLRWGIETTYDKQKNKMLMGQFSGINVECLLQDYHATLVVANIQSLIEKQCEQHVKEVSMRRKYEYKVNRNLSFAALKGNIVRLLLMDDPMAMLHKLQKIFQSDLEAIKPGRKHPRKTHTIQLNGKHKTFTNYKRAI